MIESAAAWSILWCELDTDRLMLLMIATGLLFLKSLEPSDSFNAKRGHNHMLTRIQLVIVCLCSALGALQGLPLQYAREKSTHHHVRRAPPITQEALSTDSLLHLGSCQDSIIGRAINRVGKVLLCGSSLPPTNEYDTLGVGIEVWRSVHVGESAGSSGVAELLRSSQSISKSNACGTVKVESQVPILEKNGLDGPMLNEGNQSPKPSALRNKLQVAHTQLFIINFFPFFGLYRSERRRSRGTRHQNQITSSPGIGRILQEGEKDNGSKTDENDISFRKEDNKKSFDPDKGKQPHNPSSEFSFPYMREVFPNLIWPNRGDLKIVEPKKLQEVKENWVIDPSMKKKTNTHMK